MIKKIILLTIFLTNLLAINGTNINTYKDNKKVILKIKYLNFNKFSNTYSKNKDIEYLRTWFYDIHSPIFIANNLSTVNTIATFRPPYKTVYSKRLNYKGEDKRSAIGLSYSTNEYIKAKRITFNDHKNLFGNQVISSYKVNEFMFIIINFTDKYYPNENRIPEDLKTKIKNLNKVVEWAKKEERIKAKNIIFIGEFGVSFNYLQNKIRGYKPLLKKGTKLVKSNIRSKKRTYLLANTENVLIFKEQKSIKAEIDFNFKNKNPKTKNKYKGSKNNNSFVKNVSEFFPINIYIDYTAKLINKRK